MRGVCVICLVLCGMFAAVCATGHSTPAVSAQKIHVSSVSDISTSCGELLGLSEDISLSVDPGSCVLYGSGLESYYYLRVGELKSTGGAGEPELPMKVIRLVIPGQNHVLGVKVNSGSFAEFKEPLRIVPVSQVAEWRIGGSKPELIPDPKIYGSDSYFPGRLVSFDWGCDNKNTYVYVRIFPVQYRPLSGKALLLTEASVSVYYTPRPSQPRASLAVPFDDQCVIICPDEFMVAAETLEAFHEGQESITTYIATNEWIDSTYTAVKDTPPWDGYAYEQPGTIQGYDYTLAKKIVAFMRDTLAHPNLRYISIIGDAEKVPPSYYFKFGSGSPVEGWIPSDLLYVSPDFDYVLNYCSGRIVASDILEATHAVMKARDWHASAAWSWFKNTAVTGGVPFDTPYYIGELITSDVVNRNAFNGHDVTKLYYTDNNFTESVCDDYLRGDASEDCGIFFQISHGSGPAIYYDDGSNITANELMAYPAHTNVPIIASVACDCGAWDTDLVSALGFSMSFGEGVLKSDAAGIAYFGGARSNAGSPSWYIDNGNLIITRDWYMSELLTYVWDAYHHGAPALGDMHWAAFDSFLVNNDMSTYTWNRKTYFEAILIGDPALQIPAQVSGSNYTLPQLEAQNPEYVNSTSYPVFHNTAQETILVVSNTDSPGASIKLMDALTRSTALDVENFPSGPFEYEFTPGTGPRYYLVRTVADDWKEGWMYLYNGVLIAVDGDTLDWRRAGISPAAEDPDDFEPQDLEITDLYVANDGLYWYFGFPALWETMSHASYGIALDYTGGGYVGVQGTDRDGLGNWITFDSTHAVDAEVYVFPYYDFGVILFWLGSGWSSYYSIENMGGVMMFDLDNAHFCEIAIPNSVIGDPDCIDLTLFSSGMGNFLNDWQPAQDASPSDPATYNTPHWGQSWANTLTQFVRVCKTGIEEQEGVMLRREAVFGLSQPSPNPFRDVCSIRFTVPNRGAVELNIYDSAGRLISTPIKGTVAFGSHVFYWDGTGPDGHKLPSGIYFARLDFEGNSKTAKLLKLR